MNTLSPWICQWLKIKPPILPCDCHLDAPLLHWHVVDTPTPLSVLLLLSVAFLKMSSHKASAPPTSCCEWHAEERCKLLTVFTHSVTHTFWGLLHQSLCTLPSVLVPPKGCVHVRNATVFFPMSAVTLTLYALLCGSCTVTTRCEECAGWDCVGWLVGLHWCLHRTRSPPKPRHLFLLVWDLKPFKSLRQLSLTSLGSWYVHEDFPNPLGTTLQVRAHDIWSVAMLLLWFTNKAVAGIMAVACWRTQSIFATHYLKAVHRFQDLLPRTCRGCWQLCPLMPATPCHTLHHAELVNDHGIDLLGGATTALAVILPRVTSTLAW